MKYSEAATWGLWLLLTEFTKKAIKEANNGDAIAAAVWLEDIELIQQELQKRYK